MLMIYILICILEVFTTTPSVWMATTCLYCGNTPSLGTLEAKLRQDLRAAATKNTTTARAAQEAAAQAAAQHAQRTQQLRAARAEVARLSSALKLAREGLAAQQAAPPGPSADETLQMRLQAAQRAVKAKAVAIEELRASLQALKSEKSEAEARVGALEGQLVRSRAAVRGREAKVAALQTQLDEMQRCGCFTAVCKVLIGSLHPTRRVDQGLQEAARLREALRVARERAARARQLEAQSLVGIACMCASRILL